MSVACDTLHSDAAAAACVRRDSADSWSTVATGHNCFVTPLRYILFKHHESQLLRRGASSGADVWTRIDV